MVDYNDYININTTQIMAGTGDAGDKRTLATQVVLDQEDAKCVIKGHVDGDSDKWDYYSFVAPEDGKVTIDLTGLEGNLYLRLFESDGREIGGSMPNNPYDKEMAYNLDGGETYYVAVDPYLDAASRYDLVIDATSVSDLAPAPIPDDFNDYVNGEVVDGGDANGVDEQGTPVLLDDYGIALITGTAGYGNDDEDHYTFTVAESGSLKINLTELTGALFTRLYDSQNNQLVNTVANNDDDKLLEYDVLQGQVYTVVVDPYYSAESPYTLTIDAPPEGGVVTIDRSDKINGHIVTANGGDVADTRGAASVVSLVNDHAEIIASTGFGGDTQDWFEFTVPQSSEVMTLVLSSLSDELSVTLYDSGNQEIWSDTADQMTSRSETLTPGDTYYLVVVAEGDAESTYHLSIDASAVMDDTLHQDSIEGASAIPGGDAGNDRDHAVVAALDSAGVIAINGSVNSGGEVGTAPDRTDWYSFVAPPNGEIEINLSDGGNYVANLYDAAALLSTTAAGDDGVYSVTAGATYFVAVEADLFGQRSWANYALTLNVPDATEPEPGIDKVNSGSVAGGDAGNLLSTAVSVDLHTTANIAGSVGFGDDLADYYQVTLPATDGTLTLDLTNFAATLSVDFGNGQLFELPKQENIYQLDGGTYNLVVTPAEPQTSLDKQANIFAPVGDNDNQSDSSVAAIISDYDFSLVVNSFVDGSDVVNGQLVASAGDAGDNFGLEAPVMLDNTGHADIYGSVGFATDAGDFYKLNIDEAGTVNIALSGIEQTLNALLFDGDDSYLGSVTLFAGGSFSGDLPVAADESYTLVIEPFSVSESAYHLAFTMA